MQLTKVICINDCIGGWFGIVKDTNNKKDTNKYFAKYFAKRGSENINYKAFKHKVYYCRPAPCGTITDPVSDSIIASDGWIYLYEETGQKFKCVFDKKDFITLAEFREQRINSILS